MPDKLRIKRKYKFESAHFLPNHQGKCKNLHGHQWVVEVVLEGFINPDSNSSEWGMVMDFKEIDSIVKPIIERFDHCLLNNLLVNPTAENIVVNLGQIITRHLIESINLIKVIVWESENSCVEWKTKK